MLIMAALATTLVASQFALAVWSLVDLVTASNGGRPLPDFATLLSSITRATTWVNSEDEEKESQIH